VQSREPIFNIPAAVTGTIAILVLVQATLWWLGGADEERLKLQLAFLPIRYVHPALGLRGDLPGAAGWSFVSHQLVHGDWTHLAMNSVWLLAFGGAVAQRIGNLRFLLLGLASGIAGAMLFLAIRWGEPIPMVGASGAVSGLMGGAFRFFFNHTRMRQFDGPDREAATVPRMSLREAFSDRRVLMMIAIWVAINFVTAAAGFLITSGGGIAWEAHLGGFALGLLAFAVFDRQRPPAITFDDPSERRWPH
jgi:membrane associated rhomboid family serine protease